MSYIQGIQLSDSLPSLSLLVVGSASDGPLNDPRYIDSPRTASQVYGGVTVSRFKPGPTSGTCLLDSGFIPDDETLLINPPRIYHCPPGNFYSVEYPYLTSLVGSGSPVLLSFDPIGYDPSVHPASGGLFIEGDSLYSSVEKSSILGDSTLPLGGILLPLTLSTLAAGSLIGALRLGSSWLPLHPPTISLALPTGPVLTLRMDAQGDNTIYDRFSTPYVRLTPAELIVDPGTTGLPYIRKTYSYSSYSSWLELLLALNQDCQNGFHPFTIDPITNSGGLFGAPDLNTSSEYITTLYDPSEDEQNPYQLPSVSPQAVPSAFFSVYQDTGLQPPNLLSASGWAGVLSQEDLPTEDFGFLTFSGLSGLALATDPRSALSILSLMGDSVLVLPWSLTPPCSSTVYNPATDIALSQSLRSYLGPELAKKLLLLWGWGYPQNLPTYRGNQVQVPIAYTAIASILNEVSTGNPLRPSLDSLSPQGPPYFLNLSLSEPPSGIVTHASPAPDSLEMMRLAGIIPLTRGVNGLWTLHGPVETLDGTSLSVPLSVNILRDLIRESLDPYLGEPDNPTTESNIQATLDSIVSSFLSSNLGRFAASLTLDLLPTNQVGYIYVAGSISLYTETRQIYFQTVIHQ
jgi:hypothetical protein